MCRCSYGDSPFNVRVGVVAFDDQIFVGEIEDALHLTRKTEGWERPGAAAALELAFARGWLKPFSSVQ